MNQHSRDERNHGESHSDAGKTESYDFRGKWPPKPFIMERAAWLGRLLLTRKVPPLAREDVIPMVGIELAEHHLSPALTPQQRVNSIGKVHCEAVAITTVAEVFRELAIETGFLPAPVRPFSSSWARWQRRNRLLGNDTQPAPKPCGSFVAKKPFPGRRKCDEPSRSVRIAPRRVQGGQAGSR